jgi:uncharacterized protein YjeT (DUF2065 family)
MTTRRTGIPWLAILLLADGLSALCLGHQVARRLHRVAPQPLQVALDGVLELPDRWLRAAGAAEALAGGILLAVWLRRHSE